MMAHDEELKQKPWEAVGMSRRTWYRHGKPDKPRRKFTREEEIAGLREAGIPVKSWRTWQRTMRVLQSPLAPFVESGQMSISRADKILSTPGGVERFIKMLEMFERARAS